MLSEIIINICMTLGIIFCIASLIGMRRMPDFYCRCHSSGNTETLGLLFTCVGLMVYSGLSLMSLKLLMLFTIIFLNNPLGTHALARSAYLSGKKPWKREAK